MWPDNANRGLGAASLVVDAPFSRAWARLHCTVRPGAHLVLPWVGQQAGWGRPNHMPPQELNATAVELLANAFLCRPASGSCCYPAMSQAP